MSDSFRSTSGSSTSKSYASTNAKYEEIGKIVTKRILNMKVIYQVFEDASELTNDDFWRVKLINAARGRFDKSYGYKDLLLYRRYKNKTFTVAIPPDNAFETLKLFVGFMNNYGIFSDMDIANHKNVAEFHEFTDSDESPVEWSKVPIKARSDYISNYISKLCKDKSTRARDTLSRSIVMGMKMGIIDKTSISVSDYAIVSINNIEYDEAEDSYILNQHMWDKSLGKVRNVKNIPMNTQDPFLTEKTIEVNKRWEDYSSYISSLTSRKERGSKSFLYASNIPNKEKTEIKVPAEETTSKPKRFKKRFVLKK